MTDGRDFARTFTSLPAVAAFTAEIFAARRLDARLQSVVDLVLEELFTNIVKYGAASEVPVRVEINAVDRGVEVTVIDGDAEHFDLTRTAAADVALPLEQREPGRLGLGLVRHLVDTIDYEYRPADRVSRVRFRKRVPAPHGPG